MRAEDQNFRAEKEARVPSHPGVLGQAEEITRGLSEEHLRRDRKEAGWTGACVATGESLKSAVSSTEVREIS